MVKILKLPWLPLMLKLELPPPLMVTVPAVPPVTAVVVSMMFGNAEAKVMAAEVNNSMLSSPAVALASIIACRSEPVPESALVETKKNEGLILSSRLTSSSRGKPEALRAFLFWGLLKSLRKVFKNMEGDFLYKSLKKKQIAERCRSGGKYKSNWQLSDIKRLMQSKYKSHPNIII